MCVCCENERITIQMRGGGCLIFGLLQNLISIVQYADVRLVLLIRPFPTSDYGKYGASKHKIPQTFRKIQKMILTDENGAVQANYIVDFVCK